MIETAMLVALGFTAASLLALLMAPALWRRAVRLTTRKIEATMPMSVSDITADKDQIRAEYAVELRRLELDLERARERAARHLMERNQHMVEMGKLEAELATLKSALEERKHAGSILEQTVQKRIPELEQQIAHCHKIIAARDQELAERVRAFENQTESLELAQKMIRGQEQEIERLRQLLESGASGLPRFGKDADEDQRTREMAKENGKLKSEISRLREDLMRLKEIDIADAKELRTEMQRLADLMLSGKPAVQSKKGPAKTKSASQTSSSPAKSSSAGKKTGRKAATKKPAQRTKRTSSSSKSLSERLSILKRGARKPKAEAAES